MAKTAIEPHKNRLRMLKRSSITTPLKDVGQPPAKEPDSVGKYFYTTFRAVSEVKNTVFLHAGMPDKTGKTTGDFHESPLLRVTMSVVFYASDRLPESLKRPG